MLTSPSLTMPCHIQNDPYTNVLQDFANQLWETMLINDRKVNEIKNVYDTSVKCLLEQNEKQKQREASRK